MSYICLINYIRIYIYGTFKCVYNYTYNIESHREFATREYAPSVDGLGAGGWSSVGGCDF